MYSALFLPLKAFFRKGGTASAILAIALIVAILASITSVLNHVNFEADAVSKLRGATGTFLLMSSNFTCLADSRLSVELIQILNENGAVTNVLPQKVFAATIITASGNYSVPVRAVDTSAFFQGKRAYVNGSVAGGMQVNVGEILARVASIGKGSAIGIAVGERFVTVRVVGVVQTRSQSDTELIIPIGIADALTENNADISVIEFTIKSNISSEIQNISQFLPANVEIVAAQQTPALIQDMNNQTLYFLNLWSIPVYIVVAATTYMIATRLTLESSYELTMLKMLGAKRSIVFALVLAVTFTIALVGAILGIAVGLSGTQAISTAIQWMWKGLEVAPFLEIQQTAQIILFASASSLLGCLYPSVKAARKTYAEKQL